MIFFNDYQEALNAARETGGGVKANPNGSGGVLLTKKRSHTLQPNKKTTQKNSKEKM